MEIEKKAADIILQKCLTMRKSPLKGKESEISQMIAEHPDYTLGQFCEYWAEKTGIEIAPSEMFRFLQEQKLTLQKTMLGDRAGTEIGK